MKIKNILLALVIYFFLDKSLMACPICTATMIGSFIVGELIGLKTIFIGFLTSAIVVSSTDWFLYLYNKHFYNKFLRKIENSSPKEIFKYVILKLKLSKVILLAFLYSVNYYSVFKISNKYNFNKISFLKGLISGFIFSNLAILFSRYIKRKKGKNIIKFQKTIFLMLNFIMFFIIIEILSFLIN